MPVSILPAHLRDDDHSITLRPGRVAGERRPPTVGVRGLQRMIRQGKWKAPRNAPQYLQRCAVRIQYTKGGSAGKWRSHGVYIARQSIKPNKEGFNAERDDVLVPETLVKWHKADDELFFRVIISPEFGDRLDLERHVRETMRGVEADLDTKLEWCAVVHRNTDNPHVHVAVSGRRDDGQTLRIAPDYIKEGFRKRAEQCATNQIGYRLEQDVIESQRREVSQQRFTGLDRDLKKRMMPGSETAESFRVALTPDCSGMSAAKRQKENFLIARAQSLVRMNLAEDVGGGAFLISNAFEQALRKNQQTIDRQKMMNAHGHTASGKADQQPFRRVRAKEIDRLEGRVLVHGQDEGKSGANFVVIETVQGDIVQIPHTREIAGARRFGNLAVGQYIMVERIDERSLRIEEVGEAFSLPHDAEFLRRHSARLAKEIPDEIEGWLGDMRNAVNAASQRSRLVI